MQYIFVIVTIYPSINIRWVINVIDNISWYTDIVIINICGRGEISFTKADYIKSLYKYI